MKTLAQEIGALVAGMTALEHETAEKFEERIGKVVLEKVLRAQGLLFPFPSEERSAQWAIVSQADEGTIIADRCYGPFDTCDEAFSFKKTLRGGYAREILELKRSV